LSILLILLSIQLALLTEASTCALLFPFTVIIILYVRSAQLRLPNTSSLQLLDALIIFAEVNYFTLGTVQAHQAFFPWPNLYITILLAHW